MIKFFRNAKYFQMSSAFFIVSVLNCNHSRRCSSISVFNCGSIYSSLVTKGNEHLFIDLQPVYFSVQYV